MRRRVYLAGPLSGARRLKNVERAIVVGRELVRRGFAPLVPHLTHFADPHDELGWGAWLEVDEPWVSVAEAVFRLRGKSAGADREVALANQLGVPVFRDIRALEDWRKLGDTYQSPLLRAHALVHGVRGAAYGHPLDDFSRTGRMWGAILGVQSIPAERVALMMAALKISREANAPNADNLIDLAGYAETAALVYHERQRRRENSGAGA